MSNTGATADFAVFSGEVERGLFSTVHGRGANKPVAFQPILRDDSAPHRWHGKPQALLEQIMRGVRALGDHKSVPHDLHQLSLCYLQELDSEQPAPDWAVMLGVTKNADSPPSPDLSQAQLDTVLDSLNQELSITRLQINKNNRDDYAAWLSQSSVGSLKPLFKCIRKHEASVERPFPTFSAASKLLLRLQQWSQLWHSSGTKPPQLFEDLRTRACAQARELQPLTCEQVKRYLRRVPLKAPGPDGWTPHLARALTDGQCQTLADIMRRAELDGSFPEQWTISLVVLLPKNSEIERPIALMHILLKSWMKLRWSLLDQWMKSFAPQAWWDSCGPECSCLDIAVRTAV